MLPLYNDQPRTRYPVMTALIILVNVLIFVYWQQTTGVSRTLALAGVIPMDLFAQAPGAASHLWTAMFMHANWPHLLGNMWFLWIFGTNIEDLCGPLRYLGFYLTVGAAATLIYALADPHSTMSCVGASGAIAGVMGAFLLKFPHASVRTLVPLGVLVALDVSAYFFLLVWIGLQILSQYASASSEAVKLGGVAYLAHVGGFGAGLLLIFLFQQSPPRPEDEA